jgi:acyl-CoA synthetase
VTLQYAPAPLPDELISRYARYGYRSDVLIGPLMRRNRDEFGALSAVHDGDVELTWRQLMDAAARFGGFLEANGIGPGDVVTWQLPNWWETLVVAYGIWAAGAVSNPIVPIYREHEMRQVVEAVRPSCIVAPADFRGYPHAEMISSVCADVAWKPAALVVLRGSATGWTPYDDTTSASPQIVDTGDADGPALVGFTSGTTSGAKGVVHSVRSFMSSPLRATRAMSYGWRDRSYMPATLAHATGVLSAISTPLYTGCSVMLRDHWDAEQAVDDMLTAGVTFSAGATVFVQEILAVLAARGLDKLPLSTGYGMGASTVPTSVAEAADDVGMTPRRAFGMTECPSVSSSSQFEPRSIRCGTDGLIAPGCEVRVCSPEGDDLPYGEIGEFVIRGPQRALGYLNPEHTREAFDDQGWFHTGDLGYVTAEQTLTVTGRVKEIINRGGEKISGREIEDMLVQHPGVVEAAVVPAPHKRLGEQPAAFLLLGGGPRPSEDELAAFLRSGGLAPQKIPRVWRYVDDLPRTPSGKVKKYVLQAELADASTKTADTAKEKL